MVNKKCVDAFVDTTSLPMYWILRYPIHLLTTSGLECRCPIGNDRSDKSMPDDHSKLVPPLPIPNRTVKQLCADDSAATSVKVGYRQASYIKKPLPVIWSGLFFVCTAHGHPAEPCGVRPHIVAARVVTEGGWVCSRLPADDARKKKRFPGSALIAVPAIKSGTPL